MFSYTPLLKRSLFAGFLFLAAITNSYAQTYSITANPSSVSLGGNFSADINHSTSATVTSNDFIFSLEKDAPFATQYFVPTNPLFRQNVNAVYTGSFPFNVPVTTPAGWKTVYYFNLNSFSLLAGSHYFIQYDGNYQVAIPRYAFVGVPIFTQYQIRSPGTLGLDALGIFPNQSGNSLKKLSPFFPPIIQPVTQLNGISYFTPNAPPGDYVARYMRVAKVSPLTLDFKGESNKMTLLPATQFSIIMSKTSVGQGENLVANWFGPAQANSWVGIYPLGAPDTNFMAWSYVTSAGSSGSLTFPTGLNYLPGIYEVRMFSDTGFANPVFNTQVLVNPAAATVTPSPNPVVIGSTLNANWSFSAGAAMPQTWIGAYTSGADPVTTAPIAWSYVNSTAKSGSLPFNISATSFSAGNYDIYMFADNGYANQLHKTSVTVQNPIYNIGAPSAAYQGETTGINWSTTGSITTANQHWLGIIDTATQNALVWDWLPIGSSGTVSLAVPLTASTTASYEVRMYSIPGFSSQVAAKPITMNNAVFTLDPTPNPVALGATITVNWGSSTNSALVAGTGNSWIGIWAPGVDPKTTTPVVWNWVSVSTANGSLNLAIPSTGVTPGPNFQVILYGTAGYNHNLANTTLTIQ